MEGSTGRQNRLAETLPANETPSRYISRQPVVGLSDDAALEANLFPLTTSDENEMVSHDEKISYFVADRSIDIGRGTACNSSWM